MIDRRREEIKRLEKSILELEAFKNPYDGESK